jgi:trans-aconitate methyltransferase
MHKSIDYSINYRRWHSESDAHFESQSMAYDRWLGSIIQSIPENAAILDYGCGFGLLSYYLKKRFSSVLSVDSSHQQIAVAKSKGLDAEVISLDEFADWVVAYKERFDVIFLFDVLEHVPVISQIDFLYQLVGTLRADGQIFIKVPNANSLLAARWRYVDWTHTSSFTEASLDFVCLNSNLSQPIYMDDDSSVPPKFKWIPRWGLRNYYLRVIFRTIWKTYLRSELGSQSNTVSVGYNLFARALKVTP